MTPPREAAVKPLSQRATLARLVVAEQVDAEERTTALRLQAKAWRLIAIIGTHDQEYAKKRIGWLMFVSVPCVDGAALERFIDEHEAMAREYGKLSGVFSDPEKGTP